MATSQEQVNKIQIDQAGYTANANEQNNDESENPLATFPAYKRNPVMISGFL